MEQSEELEIQVKYIRINAILSISKWKKKKKISDRPVVMETTNPGDDKPIYF